MSLKLSEAMRLGAMLRPQAFGELFSLDGGSCAIGAVMEASGISGYKPNVKGKIDLVGDAFPILALFVLPPPDADMDSKDLSGRSLRDMVYWAVMDRHANPVHARLWDIVVSLNNCGWTRERIADWVESVENQLEPAVAESPVEEMMEVLV